MVVTATPSAGKPPRAAKRPEDLEGRDYDESGCDHRRSEASRSCGDRNAAESHARVCNAHRVNQQHTLRAPSEDACPAQGRGVRTRLDREPRLVELIPLG